MEKKTKKLGIQTSVVPHLGQGDSDGSRPAANIQHRAVLVQLRPLPDSRVEHLCSSCVHLQREHTHTRRPRCSDMVQVLDYSTDNSILK